MKTSEITVSAGATMAMAAPYRVASSCVDREQALGGLLAVAGESCPWRDCRAMLRAVGLRPTRQRIMLGWLLFARGNRHITAEMLYDEALAGKFHVSLATVYNTLHQFADAGLLRQIGVDGPKSFFDTNPTAHHHYFVEGEQAVFDIPKAGIALGEMPEAPPGFEVARIDVTVRLRRKQS